MLNKVLDKIISLVLNFCILIILLIFSPLIIYAIIQEEKEYRKMNIENLGRYKHLEDAVFKIDIKVQQLVITGVYSTAKVNSAKLNTNGDPVVGFGVNDLKTTQIKTLEYTLVNNVIFPTKPTSALCDLIG